MSTLQRLLDAEQQLVQELLQPKLGERRVAQPGERLDLVCRGGAASTGRQDRLPGPGHVMVRILQGHGGYCARARATQQV